MIRMLHFDGIVMLSAALLLMWAAQSYHRWSIRIPLFLMAFFNFSLGVSFMGIYRPHDGDLWPYFRIGSDLSFLAALISYARAQRIHIPHFGHKKGAS